ncbi:MAG: 5-formyltetrahydrofolate cyclo-ligase [Moheibacter sp.]
MTKSELRKIYVQEREKFSSTEIANLSSKILTNLKILPIWEFSVFHCFVSIKEKNEINTTEIINYLFEQNKTVVVPKILDKNMISCEINSKSQWAYGSFNVSEPIDYKEINSKKIDVILLPMLICDKKGNRIGYGGGFYDRFLKKCNPNILKIGINFFEPIDLISDVFTSDVPLDYCVTSDKVVSFSS